MPPKGRIGGVFIEILGGVSSGISARYTFLSLIEIGRYTIRFLPNATESINFFYMKVLSIEI
jgi:hypothetical protein